MKKFIASITIAGALLGGVGVGTASAAGGNGKSYCSFAEKGFNPGQDIKNSAVQPGELGQVIKAICNPS